MRRRSGPWATRLPPGFHDKGDAGGSLVGHDFVAAVMVAQHFVVIEHEQDPRIGVELVLFQPIQQLADLVVDMVDRGVIGATGIVLDVRRKVASGACPRVGRALAVGFGPVADGNREQFAVLVGWMRAVVDELEEERPRVVAVFQLLDGGVGGPVGGVEVFVICPGQWHPGVVGKFVRGILDTAAGLIAQPDMVVAFEIGIRVALRVVEAVDFEPEIGLLRKEGRGQRDDASRRRRSQCPDAGFLSEARYSRTTTS